MWSEIRRILSDPQVVVKELLEVERRAESDGEDSAEIERELETIKDRERRLVKLFTVGDVDEGLIREQSAVLKRQRKLLEDRLSSASRRTNPLGGLDTTALSETCSAVADWLDRADEEQSVLALEALQVGIVATREEATIRGFLPLQLPGLFISRRAWA
ncbi:MAG: hypothetical protein HY534_05760 [Chloroflexi bacterium]|nr:hypothetical protein [Chloroflexota bacterium]